MANGPQDRGQPLNEERSTRGPRFFGLSKSKIAAFEQCPKKLWLSVHRPELAAFDGASEANFARGYEIGAIACALEPDGVMVEANPDMAAAIEATRRLIADGCKGPIFEATFVHDGVLVRVDLLSRDADEGWVLAEVKSTTGPKSYHRGDLATQVWVLQGAGLQLSSAVIRHIDSSFVLTEAGDYQGLFLDAPLLDAVIDDVAGRPAVVAAARSTLSGPEPDLNPGPHCSAPFSCEFVEHCEKRAAPPPTWPVSLLPRTGATLAARWAEQGIFELTEVPDGALENPVHARIHKATITGKPYHDREAATAAVAGWLYPQAYLDFETISFAAPRWIGTRPYQAIPFQFSCHRLDRSGALDHLSFLSCDGDDPRRACAEALLEALNPERASSIIAYSAGFERRCVLGLAEQIPEYAAGLTEIADRIVDLLPVASAHYYHRDQAGSWSIKAVLPTVAPELDYGALEVRDGQMAQEAWLEAADPSTSVERKAALEAGLEAYCARDTLAMVVLLDRLIGRDRTA